MAKEVVGGGRRQSTENPGPEGRVSEEDMGIMPLPPWFQRWRLKLLSSYLIFRRNVLLIKGLSLTMLHECHLKTFDS